MAETETSGAEALVKRYTLLSLAPSLLPFPLVDAALVSGIQLKMLHGLCKKFDVKFSSELGRSLISALVGAGGSLIFSAGSAQLLKSVPVIGSFGGAIGMATFSGASTWAVGKVFIEHFKTGGTLLTFDADKMKAYYAEQFGRGAEVVRESFVGVKP